MTLNTRPPGRPESIKGSATENVSGVGVLGAEYTEIPLPICTCGYLGKSVDNPVDNSAPRGRDSTILLKDKSLSASLFIDTLVDALAAAVDILDARVERIEHQLDQLLASTDEPISPDALVQRLRALRDAMRGES